MQQVSGSGDAAEMALRERDMALNELRKLRLVSAETEGGFRQEQLDWRQRGREIQSFLERERIGERYTNKEREYVR